MHNIFERLSSLSIWVRWKLVDVKRNVEHGWCFKPSDKFANEDAKGKRPNIYRLLSTSYHKMFRTNEAAILLCSGAAFWWGNYGSTIATNRYFDHTHESLSIEIKRKYFVRPSIWNNGHSLSTKRHNRPNQMETLLWSENSSTMQQQWRFLKWPYLSGEPLLKKLLNIQQPFRVQMTKTLYQSIVWGNLFHVLWLSCRKNVLRFKKTDNVDRLTAK